MGVSVVVFSGEGCANCVSLKRQFKEAGIEFVEKDVMENMSEARSLGVRGLPTTVVYKDGEQVELVVGLAAFGKVREALNAD